MSLRELFNGVCVIIDDEIDNPEANIRNLIKQIESQNIPILKYNTIPSEDIIKHFQNLSFLLLDWRLVKEELSDTYIVNGLTLPDGLQNSGTSANIEFLKNIKQICFCPIFIFTNEDVTTIQTALKNAGLYKDDMPNYILIKSKADLSGRKRLFVELEKWLNRTPSIYVLKEWEQEYQKSKNKLFSDFQDISPNWPKIMWKNFEEDGANKSLELGELISQNLHTRMSPFNFSEEILNKRRSRRSKADEKAELRKILEGEKFLKELPIDMIGTGDLFKEKYVNNGTTRYKYFLNIRAQCDLMRSTKADDVKLYCLKGRVVDESKINKKDGFHVNEGQFLEKTNHAVIPFLDNGLIIEFQFHDIIIKKWRDMKDLRIGRLLPPYINKIQQRYALYLKRQGLPRVPKQAFS